MSPFQHGEVYVTADGAETDLDLGYYERFTNAKLSQKNSVSTGQIYDAVIQRERRGEYLGRTVQVIPHITDEIKKRIFDIVNEDPELDFVLIEIGGTVGDIESVPFLEAIRQIRQELGRSRVLNVHLTLVPIISVAGEHKTKPTQHSVKELMQLGIIPDILLARTSVALSDEMKTKIALFCNVAKRNVISAEDVSDSIYEIPYMFLKHEYDKIVLEHFGLPIKELNIEEWDKFILMQRNPKKKVKIAVVGKYVTLQDAYRSVYEALIHGAVANEAELEIIKIDSEDINNCENDEAFENLFSGVQGILIPGGLVNKGNKGIEGKIKVVKYARMNNIPFLGICLGFHCAIIEFARNICGLQGANTTEIAPSTEYPVISLLEEQNLAIDRSGTMRLGAYQCNLEKDTMIHKIYNSDMITERYRHRFEFTLKYKELFKEKGLVFGGIEPQSNLVEVIELKNHPWFIATQYYPELTSRPTKPNPLYKDFIRAACGV
jgi:CTP synthase